MTIPLDGGGLKRRRRSRRDTRWLARSTSVLILTLSCVALPFLAHARGKAKPVSVAIGHLRFATATPAAVRKEVREHLLSALQAHGHRVHRTPKTPLSSLLPRGCTCGPCLVDVGKNLHVDRLLLGGIEALGNSYDLLFTLVDAPSGLPIAQVARRCDVCTFTEVGRAVERAINELTRRAKQVTSAQGRLTVLLPRATHIDVYLDNVPLGPSPLERLVTTGWHLLELHRRGQLVSSRRLWISPGEKTRIDQIYATIVPLLYTPPKQRQGKIRWPAWLALGSAAALIVAGSVTLALDESCAQGSCSDRRDTSTLGLGLLGGGAAMTLGAGLLVHYYLTHPQKTDRRAGFALSLTPRMASVSYGGHF